ncbi:MAG: hypothetical protein JWN30_1624 [Bacilli bacterium]|nr:hypothetical protein [Bacilli bacterium]
MNQKVLSKVSNPINRSRSSIHLKKKAVRELIGISFISPWLLGFLCFTIGPMIASIYLSFTNYDMLSSPNWVGFKNYVHMFTSDSRFVTSLEVTFLFVIVSVPLKLIFALLIAMLFNANRRGVGIYRTIYYIPSIIGGSVAVSVMWKQLFGLHGAVNSGLALLGISGVDWVTNPSSALWTLIVLVIWQFGSPMLIFMAGLKQIPNELYEAAAVDGARPIAKFFKITLPMLTPVIFFNLVMQMIGGFMSFTQSFLITGGGPLDRTLFYALYLYQNAFTNFQMGYASAMAWILLLIVALFTAIIFKSSSSWVYYESEGGR